MRQEQLLPLPVCTGIQELAYKEGSCPVDRISYSLVILRKIDGRYYPPTSEVSREVANFDKYPTFLELSVNVGV